MAGTVSSLPMGYDGPQVETALKNPAISKMLDDILGKEGGKSRNKADRGGETNLGVSLRYARGIGLDLDGDGDTDAEDVWLVTPEIARKLYVVDFYLSPSFSLLPGTIQPFMFDFAVNSGAGRATIELQEMLNILRSSMSAAGRDVSGWPRLIADGRVGRQSAAAAKAAETYTNGRLVNHLCDARQTYVQRIADTDPSQVQFLAGWTNRINTFRLED